MHRTSVCNRHARHGAYPYLYYVRLRRTALPEIYEDNAIEQEPWGQERATQLRCYAKGFEKCERAHVN